MKYAKTMNSAPHAEPYHEDLHNNQQISAMLTVTKTENIPLVFGEGNMTPGQIIDEMIRDGATKVVLDLDKEHW